MAVQLQLRRGTEAENATFIGANGELTYSTDTNGLRIHDGIHEGGFMIDAVVAFQKPTEENNYTWYRKHASGWVIQGGIFSGQNVALPVEMSDLSYVVLLTGACDSSNNNVNVLGYRNKTTTGFITQANIVNQNSQTANSNSGGNKVFLVMGYAA